MTLVRFLAVLLAVAVLAGCTRTITGQPVAGPGLQPRGDAVAGDGNDGVLGEDVAHRPVDTSFIATAGGGEIDQLAAAALLDLRSYWQQHFDDISGRPWTELAGGYHSVDTTDPGAAAPPCAQRPGDIEGNAYYCPSADAIAYDRAALLPVLAERFGDAAVVVVLAHEMGHAVHQRLGIDLRLQREQPQAYPAVLTEAMADCYAGAFVRWVVTAADASQLRIGPRELDRALSALVTFRDPVGLAASGLAAHGNAFDRVTSLQDGYEGGPGQCATYSVLNREFTQDRFTSITDAANGGNLPLAQLVATIGPDLAGYFERVVTQRGGQWQRPGLIYADERPDCSGDQGPVAFCPDDATVEVNDSGELSWLHADVGDYTTGTLLASRYAIAALQGLGRPVEGAAAGRVALCLAGSYSGELLRRPDGFRLSPGDLDEAVQLLLARRYTASGARGEGRSTGFERVAAFRTGIMNGVAGCGL